MSMGVSSFQVVEMFSIVLRKKQAVPTTIIIETASLVESCPSSCEKSKRSEDKVRSGSCVTLKTSGPKTIIIVAS
jgi:hypothetical protein